MSAVARTHYTGGNRKIGIALSLINDHTLTSRQGMRAHVKHFVIILTEGAAADHARVLTESARLHQHGAKVISIGMGQHQNPTELATMATDIRNVMTLSSVNDLDGKVATLKQLACNGKLWTLQYMLGNGCVLFSSN